MISKFGKCFILSSLPGDLVCDDNKAQRSPRVKKKTDLTLLDLAFLILICHKSFKIMVNICILRLDCAEYSSDII